MSDASVDSLVTVPVEDYIKLRDDFLVEWPKYLNAWNCLDSQYKYVQSNIHFPVEVCLPYGNKENGVVVIWGLNKDALELGVYCIQNDYTKLKEALISTKKIDGSKKVLFASVREELVESCNEVLHHWRPNGNIYADKTYVNHIDRDAAKNFQFEIPSDVRIENAKLEHAEDIDSVWPHRFEGSLNYFRKMIELGLTTVLVGAEKGELRGWVLNSVRGDEHALQIKNEYTRRGYGQLLVKYMGKKLANEEREVFGCVVTTNEASKAMFKKMDFKQLFITHWIFDINHLHPKQIE